MPEEPTVGWKALGVTALGATVGAVVGALTSRRRARGGSATGDEDRQVDAAAEEDSPREGGQQPLAEAEPRDEEPGPQTEAHAGGEQEERPGADAEDEREPDAQAEADADAMEDRDPAPEADADDEREPDPAAEADAAGGGEVQGGEERAGRAEPAEEQAATEAPPESEDEAVEEEQPAADAGREEAGEDDHDPDAGGEGAAGRANGHRAGALGDRMRLVAAAKEQLAELTGREPESVLRLESSGDGYVLTVEVVELSRMPPTMDIIGLYELELDGDGALQRYERTERYVRGRAADSGD